MDIQKISHVVRGLSADGVQKANSGHPGLPLGCAEIGSTLYFHVMRYNPNDPNWPNRDRFILSGGHGSMLLYSLLHLAGFDVSLDDLRNFRQLNSKTPGHPEFGHTPGVETTTGPLGQGIGNAVGMAIAERMAATRYNRPGFSVVDHYTYVLAGDGDFMEGVSAEASSLAGHLKLGKLIAIYDSNRITIEGSTDITFTESVSGRYDAYGWHVQHIDGHDISQIKNAIEKAKQVTDKPSLIIAKTEIAKGAPTKVNTAAAHGAPLGEDEVRGLKKAIGIPEDEEFFVPKDVQGLADTMKAKGKELQDQWAKVVEGWREKYPELANLWDASQSLAVPELDELETLFSEGDKIATRAASGKCLNVLADKIPFFIGGSADLAPSTNTYLKGKGDIRPHDFSGRNFNFGVREHGMGSIVNGLSLYGGFRPFAATFLVFSDYMRPTVRLAALMNLPVVFVFTHDSIFVGEDGPTHQPVEHVEALRIIPNLTVFRPADAWETAQAWKEAISKTDGPTALVLTRQGLPVFPKFDRSTFAQGAYIAKKEDDTCQLVFLASGSEVSLALEASKELQKSGVDTRVISVPCRERLFQQDSSFVRQLLPPKVPAVALEMGVGSGWYRFAKDNPLEVISLDQFGRSGPGEEVADFFGFNSKMVAARAIELIGK